MSTKWGDAPNDADNYCHTDTSHDRNRQNTNQTNMSMHKRQHRDDDDRQAKYQRQMHNGKADGLMHGRYNNPTKQRRNPPMHRRLDDLENKLRALRTQNDEILHLLSEVHTTTSTIYIEEQRVDAGKAKPETTDDRFSDDADDYSPVHD